MRVITMNPGLRVVRPTATVPPITMSAQRRRAMLYMAFFSQRWVVDGPHDHVPV